jgi:hypothetical protein
MAVTINASTSAGLVNTADTSGVLALQTAGTTAVTVDASQNVGIGTASPTRLLTLSGSGVNTRVQINNTVSGKNFGLYAADDGNSTINYGTTSALIFTESGTERMRINAGAPILCLAGGNTSATGTGIAFPATQSASTDVNTLDDYEEGTFTPTIVGTSPAGTATYAQQVGRYTKIGDRVLISIYLQWSAGTGGGVMNISGLPFTSDAASLNQSLSNYNGSVAMTAGHVMQLLTSTGGTVINVNSAPTGGGADANVAYDAVGLIIVGGSYEAS